MGALPYLPQNWHHDCTHVFLGMIVTENRFPLFGDHA